MKISSSPLAKVLGLALAWFGPAELLAAKPGDATLTLRVSSKATAAELISRNGLVSFQVFHPDENLEKIPTFEGTGLEGLELQVAAGKWVLVARKEGLWAEPVLFEVEANEARELEILFEPAVSVQGSLLGVPPTAKVFVVLAGRVPVRCAGSADSFRCDLPEGTHSAVLEADGRKSLQLSLGLESGMPVDLGALKTQ